MYLSKLVFDHKYPSVMKDVADVNGMHKRIMRAFPDMESDEARKELGILFRLEQDNGKVVAYVQSKVEPDWSELEPRSFLEPPVHKPISEAIGSITNGRTLAFRLRANPTKRIFSGKKNPKKVGLLKEEEQLEWLNRKATDGGFEVLSVRVVREGSLRTRDGKTFESALFDGVLKATDSERFLKAVESGIGVSRAYGFGLLSLAPFRGA